MIWSAIVVSMKDGNFSHSFSFTGSHDKSVAFAEARSHLQGQWLEVIAIVPGDHPVYAPSLDG